MYGATSEAGGEAPEREHRPSAPPLGGARQFTRSVSKVVRIQLVAESFRERLQQRERRRSSVVVSEPGAPPLLEEEQEKGSEERGGGAGPLPKHWRDMSNDLRGVWGMLVDGRWVSVALAVTSALALSAIAARLGPVAVFALSFAALLPLAMQLGDLTEMLAGWCGPVLGGLANATLGNVTEATVGIQALRHGLVGIEQGALLGGVLSNMLFVLGLSFLCGGLATGRGQTFDLRTTTADVGVLFIACLGVVLPTAFAVARAPAGGSGAGDEAAVLADSRATAAILFCMYGAYLAFTLWPLEKRDGRGPAHAHAHAAQAAGDAADAPLLAKAAEAGAEAEDHGAEDEDGPPTISAVTIGLLLVAVTYLVAIFSGTLVVSVFPVSAAVGVPADFIAVVLIPIVGNIAELATAVMAARHDKLDLSIAVALGSATQIALFLVPAAVMFGWAIGVPMSLDFEPTFALAFFGAVLAVAVLVTDGESHWLKGTLLLGGYAVIVAGMALNNGAAGVGAPGAGGAGAEIPGAPPLAAPLPQAAPSA